MTAAPFTAARADYFEREDRTGNDSAIGRCRIQMLRRMAQSNGIGRAAEAEQPQVIDYLN
jgi:hypothetical protein